jgi:hypothetical protein
MLPYSLSGREERVIAPMNNTSSERDALSLVLRNGTVSELELVLH